MKVVRWYFLGSLLFYMSSARAELGAMKILCGDNVSGVQINAQFDSTVTTLTSTIVLEASETPIVNTYLIPKSVCGFPIDFKKACAASLHESFSGDIAFEFYCKSKGFSGEIVLSDDTLSYSCQGGPVGADQNASFSGCKRIP